MQISFRICTIENYVQKWLTKYYKLCLLYSPYYPHHVDWCIWMKIFMKLFTQLFDNYRSGEKKLGNV
jgi:hypothetical protein